MRILMVGLATFEEMSGGSARYLSEVTRALRDEGHRVQVMTAASHVATSGHTEAGLVGQVRRSLLRLLVVGPRGAATVAARRPDVLNVHYALDGLGATLMARLIRVPVVVTFHGPWAREAAATGRRGRWPLSTRARRAIERTVYRQGQRCITLSDAFARLLADEYGVDPSLVRVVPGGVRADAAVLHTSRTTARAALGVDERPTLLAVRRLVPRMGLDLAVEALARVASSGLDAQLLLAGTGPERERLEALAADRAVADRVRFLGRVPDADLGTLYRAADVCLMPSRELEGFGFTALEAFAAGTPVLATPVGGLRELVGGLDASLLVAPDPDALARRIAEALGEPSSLPSAEECHAYARRFGWDRIARGVADVMGEAVR